MAQRLGGVFAIAISTAVFTANGHLGTPASVTAGFKPALAACAGFALLATFSAAAITSRTDEPIPAPAAHELSIADGGRGAAIMTAHGG